MKSEEQDMHRPPQYRRAVLAVTCRQWQPCPKAICTTRDDPNGHIEHICPFGYDTHGCNAIRHTFLSDDMGNIEEIQPNKKSRNPK
ncbi:hypothetical protein [Serratia quinivorans]|uniref:hypothetical protein n=1 Tax=Serratia quinivorans TaxID=137545 RepID=UPI0021BAF28A|nr:hypothetical protein [Serratia quinivorans]